MPLGKSIIVYPARPLGGSLPGAAVWEARVGVEELLDAFERRGSGSGLASVLDATDVGVMRRGDAYELTLQADLSWLVVVGETPWLLIVETDPDLTTLDPGDEALAAALDQSLLRDVAPEVQDIRTSLADFVASAGAARTQRPRPARGDEEFLAAIPADFDRLAAELLKDIRSRAKGNLRFYPNVGRYVETPDNWWTIKFQPRAQSFVVTLRGRPDSFVGDGEFETAPSVGGKSVFVRRRTGGQGAAIELKRERGSYSRFILKHEDQLETARRILHWASENRR